MKASPLQQETEGGQVLLIIMLFLLAGSFTIVSGIIAVVSAQVRVLTEMSFAKQSYIAAEGGLEDVVLRHLTGMDVSATEVLTSLGTEVSTVSTDILGGKQILASGVLNDRVRTVEVILIEGNGAAFNFGVQAGNGGFILENSSSVAGNVYSNGTVVGAGLNLIDGAVISAGPTGRVEDVHTTSDVYAHTIDDAWIEGDAYYTVLQSSTVDGTLHPSSPDQATSSFPIPDTTLDAWEAFAASSSIMTAQCTAAGGTITFDSNVSLGPVKIPCNVKFEKFPTVTVNGVIWIAGDVNFKQGPKFTINPAIGNKSVPIIVNNPSNQLTSSRVTMENSGVWTGNGNRSYILVVSRNKSAEMGGGEKAINVKNSTGGSLLVYTNHGEVLLENNTDLTMITAWRVRLQNSTQVIYDSGIASTLFEVGPGGGYTIDSWKEVE